MKTKRQILITGFIAAGLLAVGILLAVYRPWQRTASTSTEYFEIKDFDAVHAPVAGDANEYLIFGNLPIESHQANLAPGLAAFLGRWEGYDYSPPVKKDYKLVLVVQEITNQGGKAFLWMGTNLQYPSAVEEIHFSVLPGAGVEPAITFETYFGKSKKTLALAYDPNRKLLRSLDDKHRPIELGRGETFHVYKDYARYLAGKRIYPREYRNDRLRRYYGPGYLLYLPEGYEADPKKTWPLIFFLHGSGDRGDNLLLLAKASPFMMIREKGPLPFIIAAPLLNASDYGSFPDNYLEEALTEVLADYRVDPKRIYLTGLSLGGEATYRFAWHQPDTFAAIAPLAAFFHPLPSMTPLKDMPIWAIHGADDTIVPLRMGQEPVDALKKIGGNVRFSVLEGHDHDVWTDTYSDPQFYDWLLQHQKP